PGRCPRWRTRPAVSCCPRSGTSGWSPRWPGPWPGRRLAKGWLARRPPAGRPRRRKRAEGAVPAGSGGLAAYPTGDEVRFPTACRSATREAIHLAETARTVTMRGNVKTLSGQEVKVGDQAPDFRVVNNDL